MDSRIMEAGINIKDLFFVLIKKVWIMIIVGAIIGVGLGVYKIENRAKTYDVLDVSRKLNSSESDIQYQIRVQKINEARGYIDMISTVNTLIEHQRQYINDAIYMQINPENEYQSTAQITIKVLNNDTNGMDSALLAAYEREVRAGNYLDEYANEIDVKPEYIKELIYFSTFSTSDTVISSEDESYVIATMNITVIGPSSTFCDEVMSRIINQIETVYSDLNSSVTSHSISVIGVQQVVKIDDNLRTAQNKQTSRIDDLQKQIVSYNDSLDKIARELGLTGKDDILEYFSVHDDVYVSGIPTETSEKYVSRRSVLKSGIKYSLIGFAAGVFGVALVFAVLYVFGKKVKTQAQFFCAFANVRKIGVMKPLEKRTKYSRFVDVRSGDDSKANSETNNKIILYNYENLTKDYKSILITGVGDQKVTRDAVELLGLKGDFKPNMILNPEIIKNLSDYDCVVLIEQRNRSLFQNVYDELKLIDNAGTKIIGAIII